MRRGARGPGESQTQVSPSLPPLALARGERGGRGWLVRCVGRGSCARAPSEHLLLGLALGEQTFGLHQLDVRIMLSISLYWVFR
jgi:hypothetical protein